MRTKEVIVYREPNRERKKETRTFQLNLKGYRLWRDEEIRRERYISEKFRPRLEGKEEESRGLKVQKGGGGRARRRFIVSRGLEHAKYRTRWE